MTLKEFARVVPVSNDTRLLIVSNSNNISYNGRNLHGGEFVSVTPIQILNSDEDYDLEAVAVFNNMIQLTIW